MAEALFDAFLFDEALFDEFGSTNPSAPGVPTVGYTSTIKDKGIRSTIRKKQVAFTSTIKPYIPGSDNA